MSVPTFDRRSFLVRAGLASAGALALSLGGARPPARADESLAPFLHGVASGDPLADRVVLWTRVSGADGPVEVTWRVFRDLALTQPVRSGRVTTDADRDFTVKVDVDGLAAGTTYYYVFEALGRTSLTGRTRTAPAGGVDRLRFGVVSCANYEAGYFNAYARLAERPDLDAILHLGDYLYEYGAGRYGDAQGTGRVHEPADDIVSLADYRTRHAQYRLDPDLRRLHQLFPWVVVWDDHESANDSWVDGAENHDAATQGAWDVRRAAAQRAYDEWLPVRTDDPAVIYRSLPFGDLADLVMLDTRLEGRDEPVDATGVTLFETAVDDPDRRMISPTQEAWLRDTLAASQARGARWRIIGQQVMLMPWAVPGLPSWLTGPDSPLLAVREGGNAFNLDAWDGYPAERARLFAHLREAGIDGVVVLTGDIHTSWAGDLTEDPFDPLRYDPVTGRNVLGVEFVTPSVTSDNFDEMTGAPEGGSVGFAAGIQALNPHVRYCDLDHHGFVVLDVTAEAVQADWFFVPRAQPSDAEVHGASFRTVAGRERVVAADGPRPAADGAAPVPSGTPVVVPDAPAGPPPTDDEAPDVGDGGDGRGRPTAPATPGGPDVPTPARPTPVAAGRPLPVTGAASPAVGLVAIAAAAALRLRTRGEREAR